MDTHRTHGSRLRSVHPTIVLIGVYCDASYTRRFAGLAAVAIYDGTMLWAVVSWGRCSGSHKAELAALRLARAEVEARALVARLYSDSQTAAAEVGATWLPRERNHLADRLAGAARVGDRRTIQMYQARVVPGPI